MSENNVLGASVSVNRPEVFEWAAGFGVDPTRREMLDATSRFDIASITKSFTATLVWQLVDRGLLALDAPLPPLAAVPDFPYSEDLTIRSLLSHRSGLVNYRDTTEYRADPTAIITAERAVAYSGHEPLQFAPGSQSVYSSVNYLLLGLLLEQATGRPYDSLLNELVAAADLGVVVHDEPQPGAPNSAAAGIRVTAAQLTRWVVALIRDNVPALSNEARGTMANIDPISTLGAGLWGYCPCTSEEGVTQFTALGHSGASTEVQFSRNPDIAIAVDLADSIWEPENRQDELTKLFGRLRELATEPAPT